MNNGNFKGMSYHAMANANMGMNGINQAYRQNDTCVSQHDFNKKGGMMHDNLGQNLQTIQSTEYVLHIDSMNRSLHTYPDPFWFTVTLNGYGAPDPKLDVDFRNVKHLTLERIFIPSTNVIELVTDLNGNTYYDFAEGYDLDDKPYITLVVPNLSMSKTFSTGTTFPQNVVSYMLYPDKTCKHNVTWKAYSSTTTWPTTHLANINRLQIELYDEFGQQFSIMLKASDGTLQSVDLTKLPQEKTVELMKKMRMILVFTLYVIECDLSTQIKFDR
jgi:hypothetical protein